MNIGSKSPKSHTAAQAPQASGEIQPESPSGKPTFLRSLSQTSPKSPNTGHFGAASSSQDAAQAPNRPSGIMAVPLPSNQTAPQIQKKPQGGFIARMFKPNVDKMTFGDLTNHVNKLTDGMNGAIEKLRQAASKKGTPSTKLLENQFNLSAVRNFNKKHEAFKLAQATYLKKYNDLENPSNAQKDAFEKLNKKFDALNTNLLSVLPISQEDVEPTTEPTTEILPKVESPKTNKLQAYVDKLEIPAASKERQDLYNKATSALPNAKQGEAEAKEAIKVFLNQNFMYVDFEGNNDADSKSFAEKKLADEILKEFPDLKPQSPIKAAENSNQQAKSQKKDQKPLFMLKIGKQYLSNQYDALSKKNSIKEGELANIITKMIKNAWRIHGKNHTIANEIVTILNNNLVNPNPNPNANDPALSALQSAAKAYLSNKNQKAFTSDNINEFIRDMVTTFEVSKKTDALLKEITGPEYENFGAAQAHLKAMQQTHAKNKETFGGKIQNLILGPNIGFKEDEINLTIGGIESKSQAIDALLKNIDGGAGSLNSAVKAKLSTVAQESQAMGVNLPRSLKALLPSTEIALALDTPLDNQSVGSSFNYQQFSHEETSGVVLPESLQTFLAPTDFSPIPPGLSPIRTGGNNGSNFAVIEEGDLRANTPDSLDAFAERSLLFDTLNNGLASHRLSSADVGVTEKGSNFSSTPVGTPMQDSSVAPHSPALSISSVNDLYESQADDSLPILNAVELEPTSLLDAFSSQEKYRFNKLLKNPLPKPASTPNSINGVSSTSSPSMSSLLNGFKLSGSVEVPGSSQPSSRYLPNSNASSQFGSITHAQRASIDTAAERQDSPEMGSPRNSAAFTDEMSL